MADLRSASCGSQGLERIVTLTRRTYSSRPLAAPIAPPSPGGEGLRNLVPFVLEEAVLVSVILKGFP